MKAGKGKIPLAALLRSSCLTIKRRKNPTWRWSVKEYQETPLNYIKNVGTYSKALEKGPKKISSPLNAGRGGDRPWKKESSGRHPNVKK